MKPHILMIVAGLLVATGCSKEPAPAEHTDTAEAAAIAEAPATESGRNYDDAFIRHMHKHAEQMDALNLALAEGDLEAAWTPAYWLSRHDEVDGVHPEWQAFLTDMRSAARDVEEAPDLESAQMASERITAQCQGCHEVAGIAGT